MTNANPEESLETTNTALLTEAGELRQRVAELEHKLAAREEQLIQVRINEAHYRATYEIIPTMMHSIDQAENLLNVNDEWLATLGYERQEVIGRRWTDFLTDESRQYASEAVLPTFWSSGGCRDVAYQMVTKHGETIDVVLSAVIERDEQHDIVRALVIMNDVTRYKRNEEALQMSQTSLLEAQRITRIGNWDMDFVTNELHWSDEIYRIFGLTPQEFGATYEAFLSTVHPDDRAMLQAAVNETLNNGAPYSIQHRIVLPTGEVRLVHERGEVTRAADGTPLRMIGTVQDMTEQIQAEEKLREHQERLEFILEGSRDGGWDWNIATGRAVFSDQYCSLLGHQSGELDGSVETWLSLTHPDDAPGVEAALNAYLEGRCDKYEIEHRVKHKSDTWHWFLSRGKVVAYDKQHKPIRMTGTITDINDRKRAEEELRTFKAVVDNASDAISIIRASDSIIIYYNDAYRNHYRCGDSHLGQNVAVMVAPEDQAQLPGIIKEIHDQGIWRGQLLHIRQDGTTFPALESCFHIQDPNGNVTQIGGIVRDISDIVEAEAERSALQGQIIEAQRTAISELSTPLLPLANNVVALPLVGTLDSQRAQQVMETLLEGIAANQADIAIIDITGVKVVDTQVAQAIIRTAQAVKLLGAQIVLTGIQPQIAQTLVHLGADMGGVVTRSTLQDGIAYALERSHNSNEHKNGHGRH